LFNIKENAQNSTSIFHAGVALDRLMITCSFPLRLTGAVYQVFLQNFIPGLLQDVVLQTGTYFWFTHDCSPPHFLVENVGFLEKKAHFT
jgi:hypothetical protein